MTLPAPITPARPSTTNGYEYVWRHASARLQERYGVSLGLIEYTRLCLDLASLPPHARPVLAQRDADRVVLNVRVQGVQTRAVFSLRHGVIVTFLPHSGHRSFTPERQEQRWAEKQRKRKRYRRHGKHRGQE